MSRLRQDLLWSPKGDFAYAMQRGWSPAQVTDWFHRAFVDGYDWVMVPNVVGMSQHADDGAMATKPYTSGGAYLDRMTDHCGSCRFKPKVRVGEDACPLPPATGGSSTATANGCRPTRACDGPCRGWTGCVTSRSSSPRSSAAGIRLREFCFRWWFRADARSPHAYN